MMKKILHLPILIALLLIFVFTIGCEREEDFNTNNQDLTQEKDLNIKVHFLNFEKLKLKKELQTTLQKIEPHLDINLPNDNERGINSNNNSFTILTDEIVQLLTDSTETYTFRIENPTDSTSTFENFILKKESENVYSYSIYRYYYNANQEDFNYDISIQTIPEDEVDIMAFNDYINSRFTVNVDGCQYTIDDVCTCSDCDGSGEVTCVQSIVGVYCESQGGGGGSNTGGTGTGGTDTGAGYTGGSGGTGGTTNGNSNPTGSNNQAPVAVLPPLLINIQDCNELDHLSSSVYLQTAYSDVKNKLDYDYETGYGLRATNTFPGFTTLPLRRLGPLLKNPINPLVFTIMHNHFIGKYEMFGNGDIRSLYKLSQSFNFTLANNNLPNNSTYTYNISSITVFMVVRGNTYAIKIDDITKLASIEQHFVNKKKEKELKDNLISDYKNAIPSGPGITVSDPAEASQDKLVKAFLKFTSLTHDFGISLYKTSNSDFIIDSSNWNKLTLDKNQTNGIKETPCNN